MRGKFVLCSRQGSLPEVCGEFAWYLDPWNVQEWADKILFLHENPSCLEKLEQKIKQSYIPYNWDDGVSDLETVIWDLKKSISEENQKIDDWYKSIIQNDKPQVLSQVVSNKKQSWKKIKYAVMRKVAFSNKKRKYYDKKWKLLRQQ